MLYCTTQNDPVILPTLYQQWSLPAVDAINKLGTSCTCELQYLYEGPFNHLSISVNLFTVQGSRALPSLFRKYLH